MKKLLLICLLAISFQSFAGYDHPYKRVSDSIWNEILNRKASYLRYYFGGNWTISGAKNQWGNGMSFGSKSDAQLAAYTHASDTILIQWSRSRSTLAIRDQVADPWKYVATTGDLTGYLPLTGGTLTGQLNGTSLAMNAGITTTTITATTIGGTLSTASQPTITTVGTLTALTVAGAGNFGSLVLPGSVSQFVDGTGHLQSTSSIVGTGSFTGTTNITTTVPGANLSVTGGISATLTTASQPNITSLGTLSLLTVTNSITAGTLSVSGNINSFGKLTVNYSGNAGIEAVTESNTTPQSIYSSRYSSSTGPAAFLGRSAAGSLASPADQSLYGVVLIGQAYRSGFKDVGYFQIGGNGNASTGGGVKGLAKLNLTNDASADVTVGTIDHTGTMTMIGAVVGVTLTGVISTSVQPIITQLGTLSNLTVSGNVTSSAISSVNAIFGGTVRASGNITIQNDGSPSLNLNTTGALGVGAANVVFQRDGVYKNAVALGLTDGSDNLQMTYAGGALGLEMNQVTGNFTLPQSITAGTIIKSGGTSSQFLMADGSVTALAAGGSLSSGAYTPTPTNIANTSNYSSLTSQYMRVGNTVTVSGYITLDCAIIGLSQFRMTLPFASALTASGQLAGTGSVSRGSDFAAAEVLANPANDAVQISFFALASSTVTISYTFTYQVL